MGYLHVYIYILPGDKNCLRKRRMEPISGSMKLTNTVTPTDTTITATAARQKINKPHNL